MLHEGKAVLVTGAGSGIGRAAAALFAQEGARVAVADIAAQAGHETVEMVRAVGGEASFVQVDLLDHASIRQMVSQASDVLGGLDVAFNNAGHRGGATNLVDCEEDEWDLVMSLNLRAVWLCLKYEIPEMVKRGGGSIVNMASGMANFAGPNYATFATSKAGLLGLTRSAAVDFGPAGVRVNALLPGATQTAGLRAVLRDRTRPPPTAKERIPLRRYSAPEEQAEVAVWLTSDAASFITGASIVSDGGVTALR